MQCCDVAISCQRLNFRDVVFCIATPPPKMEAILLTLQIERTVIKPLVEVLLGIPATDNHPRCSPSHKGLVSSFFDTIRDEDDAHESIFEGSF